jgi:hypothetical protein
MMRRIVRVRRHRVNLNYQRETYPGSIKLGGPTDLTLLEDPICHTHDQWSAHSLATNSWLVDASSYLEQFVEDMGEIGKTALQDLLVVVADQTDMQHLSRVGEFRNLHYFVVMVPHEVYTDSGSPFYGRGDLKRLRLQLSQLDLPKVEKIEIRCRHLECKTCETRCLERSPGQ